MLGGNAATQTSGSGEHTTPGAGASAKTGPPIQKHSQGMDQFFTSLRGQESLNILDFAGASQANITFITELGHRISSEDFVRSLELAFGDGPDFYENQNDPERAERFLRESLVFPPDHFDGVMLWDALQFLGPSLLEPMVDKLYEILRPNSLMLAFFHAEEKQLQVPLYTYRIGDQKTLVLTPRGVRNRAQYFNNRGLEKLFHKFQSVKFFLTRDSLREIIVRR